MAKKQNTSLQANMDVSPASPRERRSAVRRRASASQPPSGPDASVLQAGLPRAVANDSAAATTLPSHGQIAEAAYQRFLARGGAHGYDIEDWVEAERELRLRAR